MTAVAKESVVDLLQAVRRLRGDAPTLKLDERWQDFLETTSQLCLADQVLLVELSNRANEADVKFITVAPPHRTLELEHKVPKLTLISSVQKALAQQFSVVMPQALGELILVVVALVHQANRCLVFGFDPALKPRLSEMVLRAQLIADIPQSDVRQTGVSATSVQDAVDHSLSPSELQDSALSTLDLLVEIYRTTHFAAAAYALVNGLVSECPSVDTAILGWEKEGYVRVVSISHFDKFEQKTEFVKMLESTMEEAADQGHAIYFDDQAWPESTFLSLAHQQQKKETGCRAIFTLPLPKAHETDEDVVVMLISQKDEIGTEVINTLNFLSYLIRPRLEDLKAEDESLLFRWLHAAHRKLTKIFGVGRVWSKTLAAVLSILLLLGVFGTLPHRIEANAQLTTENIRTISAPFEGRIEQASVTTGDEVQAGQVLAEMDTVDLFLQRSETQSDLVRSQAEVNRSRAEMDLIETEIGLSRVAQGQARLARLDAFVEQSILTSPIDGVVVEGERQDLLGLPTSAGQSLFRIARVEDMYLRIRVPEEDIHFIDIGDVGEFVFLSQPGQRIPFAVSRIVPMASVEGQDGAKFEVRGEFQVPPQAWWRPGMSGVVKIDQGRKQAIWVIFHRVIDRLRLWLWW